MPSSVWFFSSYVTDGGDATLALMGVKLMKLPDEPFIKRVIGLPGDTVYLSRLGITINGDLLPDPPTCRHRSPLPEGHKTIVVPTDAYYVIGDNRDNSFDSRYWGPLPADQVMGTAIMIYWSSGDRGVRWDRMFSFVK